MAKNRAEVSKSIKTQWFTYRETELTNWITYNFSEFIISYKLKGKSEKIKINLN